MKTVDIKSKGQQTNGGWNRTGCKNWWAGYRIDGSMTFLQILPQRGDRQLDCVVEVPDEVVEIFIGVGKAGKDARRETITVPLEVANCPVCRKNVDINDIHLWGCRSTPV